MLGGERGVIEVVERAQLFLEQVGAVETAVGVLDFGELGGLAGGEPLGCLEQRPAHALDPSAGRALALARGVPLGAADLIDGAAGQDDDVEGIKADLGAGQGGLDRVFIAGELGDQEADLLRGPAARVEQPLQPGDRVTVRSHRTDVRMDW